VIEPSIVDIANVSASDQLAAADRELKLRRRVYPRWVESGKMTEAKARAEIAAMAAIVDTLTTLASGAGPLI
jgi:hypothetical protein